MIGYVARDKDGSLYLYDDCPIYKEKYNGWFGSSYMIDITGHFPEFDNMSYKDEPIKVEVSIKKV